MGHDGMCVTAVERTRHTEDSDWRSWMHIRSCSKNAVTSGPCIACPCSSRTQGWEEGEASEALAPGAKCKGVLHSQDGHCAGP